MTESERVLRVLEEAKAEFGRDAVRRLEDPILAVAGRRPFGPYRFELQYPEGLYIPELAAAPWHATDFVPDAAMLEAAAPAMREELDRLLARRGGFQPFDEGPDGFTPENTTGSWNVFYFVLGFTEVPGAAGLCPRTAAALRALPNLAQSAMFSALTPGTHLWAHCGPTNTVISLSMGLLVPPGCTIRVGEEERTWREGRCLVFDDTFEHEVWNRGTGTRFIMLLDVWHPELTPVERTVAARVLWAPGTAEEQVRKHKAVLDGQAWW